MLIKKDISYGSTLWNYPKFGKYGRKFDIIQWILMIFKKMYEKTKSDEHDIMLKLSIVDDQT